GDLPRQSPAVLAPAARAFLTAVADDGAPVAVRFLLVVGGDLEGKRLGLLEHRPAVQAETRNAENGEVHGQHVDGLATRKIARRLVDGGHMTIRKGGGIEVGRVLRVVVEPETDRVLRLHVRQLPLSVWPVRV